MNLDPWTEERLAQIATMGDWKPSDVRAALNKLPGPELSKNSVAGKYYRMFSSKRPAKTEAEKAVARGASRQRDAELKRQKRALDKRLRAGVGAQVQAINRGPKLVADNYTPVGADVVALDVGLLDMTEAQCRFPTIRIDDEWRFCGHQKRDGSSYCQSHHAIVWHPRVAPTKQRPFFRGAA